MMYRIGFVGTGPDPEQPDTDGYAMAYRHATGYRRLDDCDIVACADIVPENAEAFARRQDVDAEHVYEDYRRMLERADVDVVSVCTPPSTHHDIVVGAARSGSVEAIHCEKPLATTWGDAQEMVDVCEAEAVQLTINHQNRFGGPFTTARELLESGRIGALRRFEFGHTTLYDMGSHFFDLCHWFNDGTPAEWVLAQVDYTEENRMFGTHNENQAIAQWHYENGVYGLASTGRGDGFLDCLFRIVGTDGEMEIGGDGGALRLRRDGAGWRTVDTGGDGVWGPTGGTFGTILRRVSDRLAERLEGPTFIERGIADAVDALGTDREPRLIARDALPSQELIFAAWESVRRRGRVELPLEVTDNALDSMVEEGELLTSPQ